MARPMAPCARVASLGSMATTEHPLAAEHEVLTRACGLIDRSERGKLLLTGPEAKDFLHGQVTNDIEALVRGTGCYAAFLTPKGKMLGDMRVLDGGDAGLWLPHGPPGPPGA